MRDDELERYRIDYRVPAVLEDLPGGAQAIYLLAPADGRVVVSEVTIRRTGGLTARNLRRLSVPRALEVFADDVRQSSGPEGAAAVVRLLSHIARLSGAEEEWRQALAEMPTLPRPWAGVLEELWRSSASGDADRLRRLALTAAAYVEACERRERAPNEVVARLQGRPTSRVRDDLKAARDQGLLTSSGGRGVAGGDLTDKAAAILEEAAR